MRKLNDLIIQLNGQYQLRLVRLDYQEVKGFMAGTWKHKFDNNPGAISCYLAPAILRYGQVVSCIVCVSILLPGN